MAAFSVQKKERKDKMKKIEKKDDAEMAIY